MIIFSHPNFFENSFFHNCKNHFLFDNIEIGVSQGLIKIIRNALVLNMHLCLHTLFLR